MINKELSDEEIRKFFKNRDDLIIGHMEGKIDKKSFLELNYKYIHENKIKPFLTIDSFEKGMHNYQYFNVMAKYNKMKVQDAKFERKNKNFYFNYENEVKHYYHEKDMTTFRLLRFISYKNVDAYYISMESEALEGKLYEIVLKDFEFAVLHSQSEWLLEVLRKNKVFDERIRKSVIDYYVNQKY